MEVDPSQPLRAKWTECPGVWEGVEAATVLEIASITMKTGYKWKDTCSANLLLVRVPLRLIRRKHGKQQLILKLMKAHDKVQWPFKE